MMMPPGPFYEDPNGAPFSGRRRYATGYNTRNNSYTSHHSARNSQARGSASYHNPSSARPNSRQSHHGGYDSMPNSSRSYSYDSLYTNSGTYIPPGIHHSQMAPIPDKPKKKNYNSMAIYKPTYMKPFFEDDYDQISKIPGIEKLRKQGLFEASAFDQSGRMMRLSAGEFANKRYIQNTACFPELPHDAHFLLFRMGIDIFDCTDVDFHQTLGKSQYSHAVTQTQCLAVLAKKTSSGQVWLIVFKIIGQGLKSHLIYCRLLTLSCSLWLRSSHVVELSAPSSENVLFMLNSEGEADRFLRLLHQACTVRWAKKEVIKEEQMHNLYRKYSGQDPWSPSPRGPFTLATSNKTNNVDQGNGVLESDLDDNWRSTSYPRKNSGAGGDASSQKTKTKPGFIYTPRIEIEEIPIPEEPPADQGELILTLKGVEIRLDTSGGQHFSNRISRGNMKSLGRGEIQVYAYEKGAHELVFTNAVGNQARDFTHFVFKWSKPCVRENNARCVMWKGAAAFGKRKTERNDLIGYCVGGLGIRSNIGVFDVPGNKKFCAFFETKEDAEKLYTTMKEGVDKVTKVSDIGKHVKWYIDNRCGPLILPSKYPMIENPFPIFSPRN